MSSMHLDCSESFRWAWNISMTSLRLGLCKVLPIDERFNLAPLL